MKRVYTHENRMLVSNARNLVENAGIETVLRNEYAGGGVGELSPWDTWVELWVVNDADYDAALDLVAQARGPENAAQWRCPQCHELNDGAFEVCWNCQSECR